VRLLAGPTNARERMINFLNKTKKEIDIYAPSFSDSELIQKLSEMCREGREVRLLLANYGDEPHGNKYGDCIQVHTMKKPLHAKALIRDKESVFVGSFNYTKNSLERNREV
jgi:phosphatidylserine/phosphatidylglycerophosphate/cardiolipin synthase-like enzyme